MGWKGTLRTIRSTANKIERESKKRERELLKQRKVNQKLQEKEDALLEVEEYENYIDRLKSIHKEIIDEINWNDIYNEIEPVKPLFNKNRLLLEEEKLQSYKPTFFQKIFNTASKYEEKLKDNIIKVKSTLNDNYNYDIEKYELQVSEYNERKEIAKKILNKDLNIYLNIIDDFNPFAELNELGSSIEFYFKEELLCIDLQVHSNSLIPNEIKQVLKSGKLSKKNMPKGIYNDLYQDYVCSSVIRVAREIFGILPLDKLVINAKDDLLNSATGYIESKVILSVLIEEKILNNLNLDYIDPSDSMTNFKYKMNFKKTLGFKEVEHIL